jgi:DNA adenine methylase
MGVYKNPLICDSDNLLGISAKLQNVTIVCGDYKKSSSFIDEQTFIYFDPPYRPLTMTASFTSYTSDGFDDLAQRELAEFVDAISRRGAKVVVSNSDPKNVDENDNFFDKLYERHQINRVKAVRMINSNGQARGKINELLICSA